MDMININDIANKISKNIEFQSISEFKQALKVAILDGTDELIYDIYNLKPRGYGIKIDEICKLCGHKILYRYNDNIDDFVFCSICDSTGIGNIGEKYNERDDKFIRWSDFFGDGVEDIEFKIHGLIESLNEGKIIDPIISFIQDPINTNNKYINLIIKPEMSEYRKLSKTINYLIETIKDEKTLRLIIKSKLIVDKNTPNHNRIGGPFRIVRYKQQKEELYDFSNDIEWLNDIEIEHNDALNLNDLLEKDIDKIMQENIKEDPWDDEVNVLLEKELNRREQLKYINLTLNKVLDFEYIGIN